MGLKEWETEVERKQEKNIWWGGESPFGDSFESGGKEC